MRTIAHHSRRVHRYVGLHYLLAYALRHPKACGQWVDAIATLLTREARAYG